MKQAPNNPPGNALTGGTTEELVADAISRSGYPLQVTVARLLRESMRVHEEWAYLDRDTKELRALDMRAHVDLYDVQRDQPRIRPTLELLIECRLSELPYLFFLSSQRPWTPDFPVFAGLAHRTIEISTDDDRSTWGIGVAAALGLDGDTFLTTDPPHCTTLSKCVRKGKELDLSGTEPYQSIVLPLLKALLHLQASEAPPKTALYFDLHIGIGVAVLDAPMISVEINPSGNDLALVPWVRVGRHEYLEDREWWDRSRFFAVDIVHKDFLGEYGAPCDALREAAGRTSAPPSRGACDRPSLREPDGKGLLVKHRRTATASKATPEGQGQTLTYSGADRAEILVANSASNQESRNRTLRLFAQQLDSTPGGALLAPGAPGVSGLTRTQECRF